MDLSRLSVASKLTCAIRFAASNADDADASLVDRVALAAAAAATAAVCKAEARRLDVTFFVLAVAAVYARALPLGTHHEPESPKRANRKQERTRGLTTARMQKRRKKIFLYIRSALSTENLAMFCVFGDLPSAPKQAIIDL